MTAVTNHVDIDEVIARIDGRGYCVLPDVIPTEKADQARTILEGLLEAEIDDGARERKHQRVGGIAHKDPVFLELMCHPLIVALWKRYLGDDIMCSSWTANTIYPGHDAIGWHADYPFWSLKPPWPPGRFAGQTVWLLDDFTEENGATATIPGSHRKGHPPDAPTDRWRPDGEILTGRRGSVVVAPRRLVAHVASQPQRQAAILPPRDVPPALVHPPGGHAEPARQARRPLRPGDAAPVRQPAHTEGDRRVTESRLTKSTGCGYPSGHLPPQEDHMDRYATTIGLSIGLFSAGVMGGLAVGLAAGILLAPRSGRESREAVRRGVGQAVDKGQSYVSRFRNADGEKETVEL